MRKKWEQKKKSNGQKLQRKWEENKDVNEEGKQD